MFEKEITFDRFIRGLILVLGVVAGIWLLNRLSAVLLPFFVAWLLAYMLYPLVRFLQYRVRVPGRFLSIVVAIVLVLGVITGLVALIVPPTIKEFSRLSDLVTVYLGSTLGQSDIPQQVQKFVEKYIEDNSLLQLVQQSSFMEAAQGIVMQLWGVLSGTISFALGLLSVFVVLLYMFFILTDYETLSNGWAKYIPGDKGQFATMVVADVKRGMNAYFRGQSLVALCVGILFSIGFLIIDFPLAIGLGLFIGLLNMVPYLQLIGFIPTILLAMLKAADTGQNFWVILLMALAVFAVVQAIQDMFLTPRIMGHVMGLNPAIILLSLSIWGSLLGFIGLIIALPLTTLCLSYYRRFVLKENMDEGPKASPPTPPQGERGGDSLSPMEAGHISPLPTRERTGEGLPGSGPVGLLLLLLLPATLQAQPSIAPCPPLPSPQQVAWQQMETYAFVHFGLNTFTDQEWGYGDVPLEKFNPTDLDCEQWAETFVRAGMKGVILTAKHHDGFCLWPTRYTDYSVRNTPYRDGKGDIVGQLAEACRKHGLRMGVYLSPWDRHQAFYGTPLYVSYYHLQMEELLTQYGDIFEVWLDGANGGDGWYGGAREERRIDRRTYYEFPRIHEIIYKHQPQAIIFSDGGPGCRWTGNESGVAGETNWAFLRIAEVYPGYPKAGELHVGHADGDTWVPSECDVSIRPGWFYHAKEDGRVKTPDELTNIYYQSVGRNSTMLLNFPVDRRGRIHPTDSANAVAFHQRIQQELAHNVLLHRGGAETDDDFATYTPIESGQSLEVKLSRRTAINRLLLQEYIPLGQRVGQFRVEYHDGHRWLSLPTDEQTTTIGYKRILRFPTVQVRRLRLTIIKARATTCLSEMAAYEAR